MCPQLFQVGKIFRAAHQEDNKALHQAKAKARDGVPQAQNNFADALDELEKDLTTARSVLNRDLANLRNRRAERERAAGAARLQNGQAKAIKQEAKANGKSAVQKNQANGTKAAKDDVEAEPSKPTDSAPASTQVTTLDDIDSMFMDDLGGSGGLDLGVANQDQPQDIVNGTAMSTDSLFDDGAMNIDGNDFTSLGGNGDATDISTLLPGLEKYVNQNQDNSGSNSGQNAANGVDDFDLEALLNDMTGGGDSSQHQDSTGTRDAKARNGNDGKADAPSTSTAEAAPAPEGQASVSSDTAPVDAGAMEFSNENTFDLNFDELTSGAGDGSALASDDNIGTWFNFD